jgi:hypothetical protein
MYTELCWRHSRPRARRRSRWEYNIKTDRTECNLNVSIGVICLRIGKVAGWCEGCYGLSCPLKCGEFLV